MRDELIPQYPNSLPDLTWFYNEFGQEYVWAHEIWYRRYLRTKLSERQNHRCCYCGVAMTRIGETPDYRLTMMTIEHVVPQSEGGTDDEDNLVAACQSCNSTRNLQCAYSFVPKRRLQPQTG